VLFLLSFEKLIWLYCICGKTASFQNYKINKILCKCKYFAFAKQGLISKKANEFNEFTLSLYLSIAYPYPPPKGGGVRAII
jgi:hypothetical protein